MKETTSSAVQCHLLSVKLVQNACSQSPISPGEREFARHPGSKDNTS